MTKILISREHNRDALRRAKKAGRVEQLRRGAYRTLDRTFQERDRFTEARERAITVVRAVDAALRAPHWISHASAALLWGCRLWTLPTKTHVTQLYRASSRSATDIARHRVPISPQDAITVRGVPVTTLERTAIDCATTMHPLEALVIVDQLLQLGMDRDEALTMLAVRKNRKGTRVARLLLEIADAGAESPWETWLRYILIRAGLPKPRTQVPVTTAHGEYRADLELPEWGVLIEFDGFVKYQQGVLRPDHDADEARFKEKLRDDALRELGHVPVRITARDTEATAVAKILTHIPPTAQTLLRPNPLLPPP